MKYQDIDLSHSELRVEQDFFGELDDTIVEANSKQSLDLKTLADVYGYADLRTALSFHQNFVETGSMKS